MRFVLVPGGWQGGWTFDPVATRLAALGHAVTPVTLPGLEPAADPPGPLPNLGDHVRHVLEVLGQVADEPFVLGGHSYGGMVVRGVVAHRPAGLAHVVYLDAYVPDDGDSCWSLTSDPFRRMFVDGAAGDGRVVAVPDGLDGRARPHPMPSFLQAIRLAADDDPPRRVPHTYVSGGAWPGSPFTELVARLRTSSHWTVHELPVGHNLMRLAPDELSGILHALAAEPPSRREPHH